MRKVITIAIIVVTVYMLSVVTYDAAVFMPEKTKKINRITKNFDSLKTYLDKKLPEIDSALIKHAKQIDDQNRQILELNNLTRILKEENDQDK